MRHKFIVVIESDCTKREAQRLLGDIGGFQGSLPPDERIGFRMEAYPMSNKPTIIMQRSQ